MNEHVEKQRKKNEGKKKWHCRRSNYSPKE